MQALSDWDFTCRDVNEMCFCFKCEFPLVKGNILTLETCQKCFLSNRWIRKEYHLWPNYHVAPIYLSDNPPNLQCPAAPSEHHYNRHTTDPQLLNSSNEILWLTYSLNHPCFELLECPCMYGINDRGIWWPADPSLQRGGTRLRLKHLPGEWGVNE